MYSVRRKNGAKKILKQYANAERNARIEYIDRITCKLGREYCQVCQTRHTKTLSLKKNLRFAILIGILLTIAAFTGIVIASNGGINVPGLYIREGAGELIVSYADGYGSEEDKYTEPLKLEYIPEGYELEYVEKDDVFGRWYEEYLDSAENDGKIILIQRFKKDDNIFVSTYLSDVEVKKIERTHVCIVKGAEYTVYIFIRGNIMCEIITNLPSDDAEKVVCSIR